MNREQIIEMAREAGIITGRVDDDHLYLCDLIELDHFASLVADAAAAAEREECAKVCDRWPLNHKNMMEMQSWKGDKGNAVAGSIYACAAAIRARGQQ
jgi:hypothetical protein